MVFEWHKRFREGRDSTEDDPRSGRPCTSTSVSTIDIVEDVILSDRRLTVQLVATKLSICWLHPWPSEAASCVCSLGAKNPHRRIEEAPCDCLQAVSLRISTTRNGILGLHRYCGRVLDALVRARVEAAAVCLEAFWFTTTNEGNRYKVSWKSNAHDLL